MLDGGFLKCERLGMTQFLPIKSYGVCGIETEWAPSKLSVNHARVQLSNDQAELFMDLVLETVLEFSRRNMQYSHGLPRRQTLLLDPRRANKFIEELRFDHSLFRKLEGCAFSGVASMVKRSLFQRTPVIQLLKCLETEEWQVTPRR